MLKPIALALIIALGQVPSEKEELPKASSEKAAEPQSTASGETAEARPSLAPEPEAQPPLSPLPPKSEVAPESRKTTEEPAAPISPGFAQFSDFTDTRLTFAFSNVNVFAGPGQRIAPTSGYRIGVDRNFNLFLENVNTRFSGYETLSHIVLYKKLPGFWKRWETEAALAALVLADTDTGRISFFDSGTYLRIIRKLDDGPEDKVGSVDFTAWPVSADRFRLGYTYIISWGGTSIFPGKLQSSSITEGAVPGARLRWRGPGGKSYAFAGFKTALLLSRNAGVEAGEQVPNYGALAGGGIDLADMLLVEMNGGYFQKGTHEGQSIQGHRINAVGISARTTLYQGQFARSSNDFKLYRNDPNDPVDYLLFQPYRPGKGFSIAIEGSLLSQNLEDPDRAASEKLVPAVSAGLVTTAKLEELTLRLDAFFQSPNFILFNVPGFVPFQATPAGATTSPEFFLAGTTEYALDALKLRPSLSIGVKVPATYKGKVLAEQGTMVGGATPGELRTQVIVDEVTRIVLPPGKGATPILGAVLKVPFALSPSTAIAAETRFELNDNQPRLAQENELGQLIFKFDRPYRLSLALLLQSRW